MRMKSERDSRLNERACASERAGSIFDGSAMAFDGSSVDDFDALFRHLAPLLQLLSLAESLSWTMNASSET